MVFHELLYKGLQVQIIGGDLSGLSGEIVLIGEERREVAIKIRSGQIFIVDTIFLHAVQ